MGIMSRRRQVATKKRVVEVKKSEPQEAAKKLEPSKSEQKRVEVLKKAKHGTV